MIITKEQLTEWYNAANNIPQGKAPPITTDKIFTAMLYAFDAGAKSAVNEPVAQSTMTAHRAQYFMERFKREEKLLGPNEQAALDFVISMLATPPAAAVSEPVAQVVRNGAGQVYLQDGKGGYFDVSKYVGQKLYTTPPAEAKGAVSEPVAWYIKEHGDVVDLEWDTQKPNTTLGDWKPLYTTTPAEKREPQEDAGLPPKYMLAKLQMVMPLFQEARDALTAITEMQRNLYGISRTLASRMDDAGTFDLDAWNAIHNIGAKE